MHIESTRAHVMAHAPEYDYKFKLVMIGDSGVGKTSICEGYHYDRYPYQPIMANLAVHFCIRTITLEGKRVKLLIVDTAGQERFRNNITAEYYKKASGILLVYDVTNEDSFQNVGMWLDGIKKSASENVQVIYLLGNKTDLTRKVSTERGRMMADEHGLKFMETSAQTGGNVELAFLTLVKDIKCLKDLEAEESKMTSIATNNDRSTARQTIWSNCSLC